jgi:hypothetical protein
MFMQWIGVYNMVENDLVPGLNYPHESEADYNTTYPEIVKKRHIRDWGFTLGGMLLLLLTNTFYNMATVFPPEVEVGRAKPRQFVKPVGDVTVHLMTHRTFSQTRRANSLCRGYATVFPDFCSIGQFILGEPGYN